jgi:hypothetical protein
MIEWRFDSAGNFPADYGAPALFSASSREVRRK